jgi:RNA-directed DNA polymerase
MIIREGVALPTDKLIHRLNQKITGWTNYYRGVVSSRIFARIDSEIFLMLKRWGQKRHVRKGTGWIIRRYFTRVGLDHWRFYCTIKDKEDDKKPLYLKNASATRIRRHKKILASANPFDPQFKDIQEKFRAWLVAVNKAGLIATRKRPGWHDESLHGDRKGTIHSFK